jgi:phenylalanine-4-hydroxylase
MSFLGRENLNDWLIAGRLDFDKFEYFSVLMSSKTPSGFSHVSAEFCDWKLALTRILMSLYVILVCQSMYFYFD